VPENEKIHIFMPAHASAFLMSNELAISNVAMGSDLNFTSTLSGTSGYVRLLNETNTEVDRVGWGVSTPDNDLALAAPSGKVLVRKLLSDKILQDSDINSSDFTIEIVETTYSYGLVYELVDSCLNINGIQDGIPDGYQANTEGGCDPMPVDVCHNLDGFQSILPIGFGFDAEGDCQPDVCMNIDGLQAEIPNGFESDIQNNCTEHDECKNLDGIQSSVPIGMFIGKSNNCTLSAAKLAITELLPNAIGSDFGNEYVEIYNPNEFDVDLSEYQLFIGEDRTRSYSFPRGVAIKALSYMAFSDDDMGFRLVNTTSAVQLETQDEVIDVSDEYINSKEGESWAKINNTWQYTNQVTLGLENKVSIFAESGEVLGLSSELEPCSDGYYRNADTKRCRKIVSETSVLSPCKDGQYRSETTGRCRSLATDVATLIPCAEGEERNADTNRCRKVVVAVSGELTPCKAGQERNPTTNRCRNIVTSVVPVASYAPEKAADSSNTTMLNWSLVFVALAAVGYGFWEWRLEISKIFKKR
jgi:hypothetical protein